MEKNPAFKATVPKHKSEKRVIWDAETFAYALDVCENECLKLCMNLAFAGSLRIGELLGLTWDCVDISEDGVAIALVAHYDPALPAAILPLAHHAVPGWSSL